MSVFSSPKKFPDMSLDALNSADPSSQVFRDRSTPFWATALSLLFSLGGGVCLFSIAVFMVFFYELVAQEGQQDSCLAVVLWRDGAHFRFAYF